MSDTQKNVVCILCPRGCRLTVDTETLEVVGNSCKRGLQFGPQEIISPRRGLTTTASIENALYKQIPVRTTTSVEFNKIFDCIAEIKKLRLKAPIKTGDVLIKNILDTGADVIASRSL